MEDIGELDRLEEPNVPRSPSSEKYECFQNYTASEVFVQGLAGLVSQGDVEIIIRSQKQMLQRFEKTNEMLLNCNALSENRLRSTEEDFKKHVFLLKELKKDLDVIFKKIRNIKAKLNVQYPEAFNELKRLQEGDDLEEEDEGNGNSKKESTVEYEQMAPSSENSSREKLNDKAAASSSNVKQTRKDS